MILYIKKKKTRTDLALSSVFGQFRQRSDRRVEPSLASRYSCPNEVTCGPVAVADDCFELSIAAADAANDA